ncbi:ABC transporter permease subunit [Saccharopolyspora spinosporotrichia]
MDPVAAVEAKSARRREERPAAAVERNGVRAVGRYVVGGVLLGIPLLLALFGPLFASGDLSKDAAFTLGGGHLFGTDFVGRDVWNEVLLGGRSVVLVAAVATAATYALAVPIGLLAGMTRSRLLDEVVMRPLDVVLAIPSMLMLLLLASIAPNVLWVLIGIVVLINLPDVIRIARASALSLSARPSVEAMRMQGRAGRASPSATWPGPWRGPSPRTSAPGSPARSTWWRPRASWASGCRRRRATGRRWWTATGRGCSSSRGRSPSRRC